MTGFDIPTDALREAALRRHSVRRYEDRPLEPDAVRMIRDEISRCNAEGLLRFRLLEDAGGAFGGILSRGFSNVRCCVALVKRKGDADEKVGYYGERIVLLAQSIGLRTCWVGGTCSKRKLGLQLKEDEKLVCVITVGYGAEDGREHTSKAMGRLCSCPDGMPEWFERGMELVMLAPSAVNQQKFLFVLDPDDTVRTDAGVGAFTRVDLGIARLHFELGAGTENFRWSQTY